MRASSKRSHLAILVACFLIVMALLKSHQPVLQNSYQARCSSFDKQPRLAMLVVGDGNFEETEKDAKTYLLGTQFHPLKCSQLEISLLKVLGYDQLCTSINAAAKNYDFMVAFDQSIKITSSLDVNKYFVAESFAVIHEAFPNLRKLKTFQMKNVTGVQSRMHFSSKIFGGSAASLQKLCDSIENMRHGSFHANFNQHLHENHPFKVISTRNYGNLTLSSADFSFEVTEMNGLLKMPPFTAEEKDYATALEQDDELRQTSLYQKAAQTIADNLKRNYIAKVKGQILGASNSDGNQQVFSAICKHDTKLCGGLGDRLRGLSTAFYIAIATDRIFHIEHLKPVNLDEYFQINGKVYEVPDLFVYQRVIDKSMSNALTLNLTYATNGIVRYLNSNEFEEALKTYTGIEFVSNRYSGLEAMFKNPKFSPAISQAADFKLGVYEHGQYDYPLFISAAIRISTEKMSDKLAKLFKSVIENSIGFDMWENSVRVGIQIRIEKLANFPLDQSYRVKPDKIYCFAQELRKLYHERIERSSYFTAKNRRLLLFITSDWPQAFDIFGRNLTGLPNVTIFQTGDRQNLSIIHLDQADRVLANASHDAAWLKVAKSYLDWHILTKMDFLIISRSGYGETASMASLAATKRFTHWDPTLECHFQTYNTYLPSVVSVGPHYLMHSL